MTRPYIPVLMETFIYDLLSLPNHTDHGKGLLAVITWQSGSVLLVVQNITELPTIPVQHCSDGMFSER